MVTGYQYSKQANGIFTLEIGSHNFNSYYEYKIHFLEKETIIHLRMNV